jgi:hypothetical protein
MMTIQRAVQVALMLLALALIMTLISIFYEGFSLIKLWGLLSVVAGGITVYFYMLPASKVVRATFVMQPDGVEDRLVQAMAMIGFTLELRQDGRRPLNGPDSRLMRRSDLVASGVQRISRDHRKSVAIDP